MANPHGSLAVRECLKQCERRQIGVLSGGTRQDLRTSALQSAQSGGQIASQAAETIGKSIYVVRASDSVHGGNSSPWFRSSSNMRHGDSIVVPLVAKRMGPLSLWTSVTTNPDNIAVSVAVVNSF